MILAMVSALVFFMLLAVLPLAQARVFKEKDYMYAAMDPAEAAPIQEYVLPEGYKEGKDEFKLPDFLSDPHSGNRVVEFYAPWCPHCKHFKPHFISFARTTNEVAAPLNVNITFHAVSCTVHRRICQTFDVHSYPTVRLFPAGDINGTLAVFWKLHPFQTLRIFGVDTDTAGGGAEFAVAGKHGDTHHRSAKGKQHRRNKEETFSDAMLSFDFALRNSIFMSIGPLKNKTYDAFSDWLELLQEALPPQWSVHKTISALIENYENITQSENTMLKVINQHHQPQAMAWSQACSHGEDGTGYTCGLWELFHIMTVGVVEWNTLISNDWTITPVEEAADCLRNYVESFFACEVCRTNFIADYEACGQDRCNRLGSEEVKDYKQLPLWLWETHNAVNVRLMREHAAREGKLVTEEDEIRVRWPSHNECPLCWLDDGMWDEDVMYKFLRMEYWPDDADTVRFRHELQLSMPISAAIVEDEESSSFSKISVFLVIVLVAILLTALASHFIRKKNRHKTGRHKKSDGYEAGYDVP
jgi:thiol oxidase